jgi:hypothetical protein
MLEREIVYTLYILLLRVLLVVIIVISNFNLSFYGLVVALTRPVKKSIHILSLL